MSGGDDERPPEDDDGPADASATDDATDEEDVPDAPDEATDDADDGSPDASDDADDAPDEPSGSTDDSAGAPSYDPGEWALNSDLPGDDEDDSATADSDDADADDADTDTADTAADDADPTDGESDDAIQPVTTTDDDLTEADGESAAASDGGTVTSGSGADYDYGEIDDSDPFLDGPEYDREMPLADHIEEMVNRVLVVVLVMALISIPAFLFADQIINYVWYNILGAAGTDVRPHVYAPLALVLARLKTATLVGFVIGLPVFVYETYLFMRPGLYPHERRYYLAAVPTSLVLAGIGVAFAFYLVLPGIFVYFLYYSEGAVDAIAFGLTDTYGLMLLLMGFFAAIFQIPLLIMLAIMMGLTTRKWLAERRLYFWGAFLGIAFLFSPDPTGMAPIIVALTMVTLFEGTLLLLRWTGR